MTRSSRFVLTCLVIGLLGVGVLLLRGPAAPLAASLALPTLPIPTTVSTEPELGFTTTTPPQPLRLPTPDAAQPTVAPASTIPVYGFRVLQTYPHDREAFTQGLVFDHGTLFESTGLNGRSSLRQVELETGKVLRQVPVAAEYFAEGLALVDNRLIQLTWQSHIGFIYEKDTFKQVGTFEYPTEGWGLAYDGTQLYMSDGTATIHVLDPQTLQASKQITVTADQAPIMRLNELEIVDGELWANIWQTDTIARIDLATGNVVGWIDLGGLLSAEDRAQPVDVLNGIAYDPDTKHLYITGKLWPRLFQIELVAEGTVAPVRLPLVLRNLEP